MELTEEEANDPNFIFKRFDANGDRKIAQDELPNSRSRDAFNFVDRDRDGFWSVPELAALGSGNKAPGRNVMVAVEAGHQGELTEKKGVVWTYERSKALPYVPTPLLMDGRIHLVKSGGVVTCLDASSGEAVYGPVRSGVSGEYYASPVAWGDRILLCSQRGTVLILAAGDKFDVLAKNDLGEEIHATPAIVDGTLYLRTSEHLWAIGKKG
jgi:outer membrane protein assembly factor BamB